MVVEEEHSAVMSLGVGRAIQRSLFGARGCLVSFVRRTTHTRQTEETKNQIPPRARK